MANIKAAEKAIRTSARSHELNRALKRRIKTWQKKMDTLIKKGSKKPAQKGFQLFAQLLDKAGKRNVFHLNKVNRYKSRYQKRILALGK